MTWFEVDKEGLKQLLFYRNKSFIFKELLQNAWDEDGVTWCNVYLEQIPNRPLARVTVEDNAPEGFYNLSHAYTFYAHTRKRQNPNKRGRFNIGEKEVLSLCKEAYIQTTKGTIKFLPNGERKRGRKKREAGSIFVAEIPMTRAEIAECEAVIQTFIPPKGITTCFNKKLLPRRERLATVEATLATEYEDAGGRYRSTHRQTEVYVYEPLEGEQAMLYEMGLPVCETGDRWHYDIQQRVPLSRDRDTVKPSFLQDVRAEVLSVLADDLNEDDAGEQWVRDATADDRISEDAVRQVVEKRWGDKVAVATPGHKKSKEHAIANGYHLVSPRELSSDEWEQVKRYELIPATSKLFPQTFTGYDIIPEDKWTDGMKDTAELTRFVAKNAFKLEVTVEMIESDASNDADYGDRHVRFNVQGLGKKWFDSSLETRLDLIIHEICHEYGGHLDMSYHKALTKIAAKGWANSMFAGLRRKGQDNG